MSNFLKHFILGLKHTLGRPTYNISKRTAIFLQLFVGIPIIIISLYAAYSLMPLMKTLSPLLVLSLGLLLSLSATTGTFIILIKPSKVQRFFSEETI